VTAVRRGLGGANRDDPTGVLWVETQEESNKMIKHMVSTNWNTESGRRMSYLGTIPTRLALLVMFAIGGIGCRTAYYGTMEAFGVHKRDILVDRVEEARNEQVEAKEQFQSALDAFHDQVLFLKHNLNAQAIASLESDSAELQSTIADLVAEMDHAIDEANAFIESMSPSDS